MAVLRTPLIADAHTVPSRVSSGAPRGVTAGTRNAGRVRKAFAMLVYSTGYPLLAVALWAGARNGDWFGASVLVALGVFMSFVGWALLGAMDHARASEVAGEAHEQHRASSVYLALYNRAGAIIVLLGSYAIAATAEGWPTPQTFIGWFALVWLPLFVSFAIPVACSAGSDDTDA